MNLRLHAGPAPLARRIAILLAAATAAGCGATPEAAKAPPPGSKTERFERDPGWEGHRNRVPVGKPKTVAQDFGHRATNFAGGKAGEIGGTLWRSPTPASYADRIAVRTLHDTLSASGTFAITSSSGSSGAFIGWFKAGTPENGRQNSLGLRFAGEGSGARITLQLVTATNQACGTKVTPWIVDRTKTRSEGRKYRPPSIRNDGTRYAWSLDYDPDGADGRGRISGVIRGDHGKPEDFEGKTFTVDLPEGYRDHGTRFDRFGLANAARPGNAMTIHLDDLRYDGRTQDFTDDPGWIGTGNGAVYPRREEGGAHDFGFSEATNHAGGSRGELGGTIWRSGVYGFYADRVGPLTLADRMEASGKVVLHAGPPDSGMYLGWFHSAEKELSPPQAGSFVGVKIGGPTRVGHYFLPAYATAQAGKVDRGDKQHPPNISVEPGRGPVLVPQTVFDWKLVYDPAANGGQGAVEATLGGTSVTLPLKEGDPAKGAVLDRFGLFTVNRGGSYVKIWFDDLTYTTAATR